MNSCNHHHVRSKKLRAYAKVLIPTTTPWRRLFWRLVKTRQHYCLKCGATVRQRDQRYYV